MKIEIKRPNQDYPLVYVHIPVTHNEIDVDVVLAQSRVTLLGRWEQDGEGGYKAPALLEDEHVKPKKKPRPRAKK